MREYRWYLAYLSGDAVYRQLVEHAPRPAETPDQVAKITGRFRR